VNVLVDTSVWSIVLRRPTPDPATYATLYGLVQEKRARVIGPIRQELLSGVREASQFERLRDFLRAFPDEQLLTEDHEQAAVYYNTCRSRGVQGSDTDLLICALAHRAGFLIYTFDNDFRRYGAHVPVRLFTPP
jgi:predicted nucleic acid-binding protein